MFFLGLIITVFRRKMLDRDPSSLVKERCTGLQTATRYIHGRLGQLFENT